MAKNKIAITVDTEVLRRLDYLVERGVFENRSIAVEKAVMEKLDRLERRRLAEECAKLKPAEEKKLADEGLAVEVNEWPEY